LARAIFKNHPSFLFWGGSWQIVPFVFSDLMRDLATAPEVVEAFVRMTQFEIALLLEATGKGGGEIRAQQVELSELIRLL